LTTQILCVLLAHGHELTGSLCDIKLLEQLVESSGKTGIEHFASQLVGQTSKQLQAVFDASHNASFDRRIDALQADDLYS